MVTFKEQGLTQDLKRRIYEGFKEHAIEMTDNHEKFDAVAFIAEEKALFLGAIVVEKFWGALHIKYLYVDKKHRGKGIATSLIHQAFDFGFKQDCSFAFVETMSFQALDFYQKIGFKLDFSRLGYAHGTSFHYLSKKLISSN